MPLSCSNLWLYSSLLQALSLTSCCCSLVFVCKLASTLRVSGSLNVAICQVAVVGRGNVVHWLRCSGLSMTFGVLGVSLLYMGSIWCSFHGGAGRPFSSCCSLRYSDWVIHWKECLGVVHWHRRNVSTGSSVSGSAL
jgi:hypothetical protein